MVGMARSDGPDTMKGASEDQTGASGQVQQLLKIITDSDSGLTDHQSLSLFAQEDMLISTIHARRAVLVNNRDVDNSGRVAPSPFKSSTGKPYPNIVWDVVARISPEQMNENDNERRKSKDRAIAFMLRLDLTGADAEEIIDFLRAWGQKDWAMVATRWPLYGVTGLGDWE